ncbi:Gfo/Idh/MocA family oxidoreductase [Paenibacillus sp. J5C_2022]|uniref:Gfo/Idh/MocA family protein n=1 Tax=Paenibacillus sp. J5C2022 TaxID=2977129 RepID=UPI0021D17ADB|nr:Gfo/Idh/MocA family oxidoreductase [Paenibacillus sp. J5C2022]MCU6712653.1 Gfo/Idh/MocA family oxidoreductase [Paenibacillus sp. J5C2022]
MLKVGLIGFGFMGRMHLDNYERLMKEGADIKLTAICDIRIEELKNSKVWTNLDTGRDVYDLSTYSLYDNIDAMLAGEQFDIVDIALPTPHHADLAIRLMESGIHVFCEKPMARTAEDARRMVEASERTGKKLMIGQCLRFWPAYEYLKACIEDGRYGAVTAGYFFRGSSTPLGWYRDGSQSGGNLMDMHVHDVDMINWLFGKPDGVSTLARTVLTEGAYDIVSTNYVYPDGKVVNAQSDWTLQGDFGFSMVYRVNFEGANLVFENGQVKVNPNEGAGFVAELSEDTGYYRELSYFLNAVKNNEAVAVCSPESVAETMDIVEAEIRSADRKGVIEPV